MGSQEITRVKIHPAIGVARVGNSNSKDGFFVGPESPDQKPGTPGFYRDATGAVKRQAARFRLYGYNADGEAVRELTINDDDVSEIEWTVHLANKKAAWYQFYLPLDVPDGRRLKPDQYARRNADIKGAERKNLVIDPTAQTIRRRKAESGEVKQFNGKIMDRDVYLGEISTESVGRLLVLGGRGKSSSYMDKPVSTVANNDTWNDDISDGPVTASVTIKGEKWQADPAWAVVGPPHYSPNVKTIRTLYDLLYDVFVNNGCLPPPGEVSFSHHIEPILERFCGLQWVNRGFAAQYGWKGPHFFLDPTMRTRLADNNRRSKELRLQVYKSLRDYGRDGRSPEPWPWIYGDGMAIPAQSNLQHMVLSPTQDRMLERWATGKFDFVPGERTCYPDLKDAPVAEQPGLLDRAALDNCAADAFHPGCEVTWPIRHDTMYTEPFRIRHRDTQRDAEPDYGDFLTPDKALSVHGPLYAQGPGDITRWMAVPWQTDTASCRSGYELAANLGPRYSPYLPTFWPAQVPNQVLKETDFTIVNTKPTSGGNDDARETAFENRAVWLRGLTNDPKDPENKKKQLNQMTRDWWKFGIVEERDYTVGDGKFPAKIQVESTPIAPLNQAPDTQNLINLHVPEAAPLPDADTARADTAASYAIDRAVARARNVLGYSGERAAEEDIAISAGYDEKVDPFHDAQ
jgi:hypothetical protein